MFNPYLHINNSKAIKRERFGMSFKDIFLILTKKDNEKIELKKKIASLEMNMEELKKLVLEWETKKSKEVSVTGEPPIIIEKINIEKIILDKYELNNNFGQLGIKELKGKLNIGATYGSEFTPKINEEENSERADPEKMKKPIKNEHNGPKVNLKANKKD